MTATTRKRSQGSRGARVFIANLFHETHCFLPGRTELSAFRCLHGEAMLEREGDLSAVDGLFAVAREQEWSLAFGADYAAAPGPVVADDVFEQYLAVMERALARALADGLDAVLLSLHGAMVTETIEDAEGVLLAQIRQMVGTLPIFAAFDLHANMTEAMTQNADALVCYRYNPHTDTCATAKRTAQLLARALDEGLRTRTLGVWSKVLWPPSGTGTADAPMRELTGMARCIEADDPQILAVNVVGGFAYADVAEPGVHLSAVVQDTPGGVLAGQAALTELARMAWRQRAAGLRRFPTIAEALGSRAADPDGRIAGRPDLIVEPADNIGGGAPGDATDVLYGLFDGTTEPALAVVNDPQSVVKLSGLKPGAQVELRIGGKVNPFDLGPVALTVELVSTSDGQFRLEDVESHAVSDGVNVDMGPCAVVRCRHVTILLTSRKTAPFDLGQLRSQGLDPAGFALIGVKAAVGHRRAYDPIAARTYEVETRAPCPSELTTLPFSKLHRPVYPLDPDCPEPEFLPR